jgi:SH3-like domain-containing protein
MRLLRPTLFAFLLLPAVIGGGGTALSQSAAPAQPGSLPPPRPAQPATTAPAATQTPAPSGTAAPAASRPPAQAAPRPPQQQARPQGQGQGQANAPRPQGQQARPQGQGQGQAAPAVGRTQPPANRRPAAAAATGAAAGAAAAGAAAAASRAPEPPPPPPMPAIGSVTGLALPRFAALRSDEVNMRVGPNTTFPIEWTFQRRDLPVQIIGEFQLWRRIRDADGAEGWVHSSTLAGRRTVLVRPASGTPEATLRRRPEEAGVAVARLRPGVIARIRECEAANPWCEVQVAGHRGFIRRAELWGIGAEEEVK